MEIGKIGEKSKELKSKDLPKIREESPYATESSVEKTAIPRPVYELSGKELQDRILRVKIGSDIINFVQSFMHEHGYTQLLPVILSPVTDPLYPDPAAGIYKRLEFEVYGTTVRPMHSMIIHKLVAVSFLSDKIFIMSPNIRLEKAERSETKKHLFEFTQMDFEVRGGSSEFVRKNIEELLSSLLKYVEAKDRKELEALGVKLPKIEAPFKVFERVEVEQKYGKDWEDELPKHIKGPVWITDLPREFYDYEDAETHKWDNFDLYVPKIGEIATGGRREFEYYKMLSKMKSGGVKPEMYSVLLKLAKEGKIKQSAGAGIGLERLIYWITGAEHIGGIQPFPKVPGYVNEL